MLSGKSQSQKVKYCIISLIFVECHNYRTRAGMGAGVNEVTHDDVALVCTHTQFCELDYIDFLGLILYYKHVQS